MSYDERWEPTVRNESRPGLLSDGSTKSYDLTTMKDEYRWPKFSQVPKAWRRELLKNYLWQEFTKQYIEDLSKPEADDSEPPNSHYKETFNGGGFRVKDNLLENLTESERYELEAAIKVPLNFHYFMINDIKHYRDSSNPQTIFRRHSKFIRPWYEEPNY